MTDIYNNQINARALIGQSAVFYCAGKPTGKSRVGEIKYGLMAATRGALTS